MAGVWAVAASAIAIIALLESSKDEPARDPGAVTGSQLAEVQRDLDNRIDGLDERIKELPRSEDLSKLEDRLKQVEDRSSNTSDDVSRSNDRLDELEQKVGDLEQQQGAGSGGSGGQNAP